jgi:hypothetical protein
MGSVASGKAPRTVADHPKGFLKHSKAYFHARAILLARIDGSFDHAMITLYLSPVRRQEHG